MRKKSSNFDDCMAPRVCNVNNQTFRYMCKAFKKPAKLRRHINSVHEQLKNYNCNLCDKAFSTIGTLKKHINIVHKGLKNHSCNLCNKNFGQKINTSKVKKM